jgi:MtfA peptidase
LEGYTDIQLNAGELHQFYASYFSYYNTLDNEWKTRFVSRCLQFISQKIITGAEGFVPDNKVKAIISASAVQLTLGLDPWNLDHFDTIIIHPSDFDNKQTGLKFKGETNLAGFIRLSWKSFISGYKVGDDNINLGLHEFTHALRFNAFRGSEQDYFVEHYFNRWLAAANEAYSDIRKKEETVFRKYGGTNINEFMSVCIEHFFESPEEIKAQYPFLYYSTAVLLNQYTNKGSTRVNVRAELFTEINKISSPVAECHLRTDLKRTAFFMLLFVIAVPMLYTFYVSGITSGASIFLMGLCFLMYFRYDFNFISASIKQDSVSIKKGLFLFRNRFAITVQLSQLVSLRVAEDSIGADWELIYYNPVTDAFYSEMILSGKAPDKNFLREMWINKVAIFKS